MPPKRAPNKKNDSAKKEFVWSDDEAELLLSVTHEYKTQHLVNGTCWESVKSKYTDILELMRKELPANEEEASRIFNKEYPHKPEEVTKEILTTKLKAIKKKFREAVDSGRRSGHGRVVYLYYELCAKIWGGSPATEQMDAGIETQDINEGETQGDEPERAGADETGQVDGLEEPLSVPSSSTTESSTTGDGDSTTVSETEAVQIGRKRRQQFSDTLAGYKQEKMKKKLAADTQMVHFAEKELELKERMFRHLESTSQEQAKAMNVVTTQLKELTNAMTGTLMLLQQSFNQTPSTPQYPYHQYGSPYLPPPHHMGPHTHQYSTSVQRSAETNTNVYSSQPLFDDED